MTGRAAAAPARLTGFDGATAAILAAQSPDGAIAWFSGGPWDAWNHAECVMALAVVGEREAALAGLEHLAATQLADGAWLSGYGNALPMADRLHIARTPAPLVRDSNFTAYPATALWHWWRLTEERAAVERFWPMVRAAIDHVLKLQHPQGDISWCSEAFGTEVDDAVLAGNASIYLSLEHGIALAALMGDARADWVAARARLGGAIAGAPHRFDRSGTDRSGFGMDWYYPVLAGALGAAEGRARLRFGRGRFIAEGLGCRCVASEPWATVAESAELALALLRLGLGREAAGLLAWQEAQRDADGAYWMGWQYAEGIAWPREKPSWTQAAMILAQDALVGATGACGVLTGR
jgi:hypothetical protein